MGISVQKNEKLYFMTKTEFWYKLLITILISLCYTPYINHNDNSLYDVNDSNNSKCFVTHQCQTCIILIFIWTIGFDIVKCLAKVLIFLIRVRLKKKTKTKQCHKWL